MAEYEKYLDLKNVPSASELTALAREILTLRKMLWLSHGHTGMYGDDGEMQCGQCAVEYGFWDWKRTSIGEIEIKMHEAALKKFRKEQEKL